MPTQTFDSLSRMIEAYLKDREKSSLFQKFMKKFGYYKIDYGFACGRHWISIDGKDMYQASGAHLPMSDEIVHKIGCSMIEDCVWEKPK